MSKLTDYRKKIEDNYVKHSLSNAKPAFNKAIAKIKSLGGKITERKIEQVKKAISEVYNTKSQINEIAKFNEPLTRELYRYNKFLFLPELTKAKILKAFRVYKAEPDETLAYELNGQDEYTIERLVKSDITWTLNYGLDNNLVSRRVQSLMLNGIEQGLGMTDIAKTLQDQLNAYTPESFKSELAERSYWRGVVANQITRLRSFQEINDMFDANIKKYWIDTRGELACEICQPFEGEEYFVEDAYNKMNEYLNYANDEDIDGMKRVSDWHDLDEALAPDIMIAGKGQTPPFHMHCYCILRPVL